MNVVTWGALAIALLVAAPVAAHLLRRRRSEELDFPPTRFVPATESSSKKLGKLEDRLLFAARALAVLALALLGATPFVHCSRLTLAREGGASVALALVVDDSWSMRGTAEGGPASRGVETRFGRAKKAASELLDGSLPGDAVAIVLAGAPARVALAPSTDLALARKTLEALAPSDRATDLDAALPLARDLLKELPQPSKRLVLLSDLADGHAGEGALAQPADLPAWQPPVDLQPRGADCALTQSSLRQGLAQVELLCAAAPGSSVSGALRGRKLLLRRGEGGPVLAERPLPEKAEGSAEPLFSAHLELSLPARAEGPKAPAAAERLLLSLEGPADTVAEDDACPVLPEGTPRALGFLGDLGRLRAATGGPLPLEQAAQALRTGLSWRPLTTLPEGAEELREFAALVLDDPPGFTPEAREALGAWVRGGGVALLTLGPHAGGAPLGFGFEPLLPGTVRWSTDLGDARGAAPEASAFLGPAARGMEDLHPRGRALLDPVALQEAQRLASWTDGHVGTEGGAPLFLRRSLGRGSVFVSTLPLDTAESDLALRPGFLRLLEKVLGTVQGLGGSGRLEAGQTWTFEGQRSVSARRLSEESTPLPAQPSEKGPRLSPSLAGLYELEVDGETSLRAVDLPGGELDLRPRTLPPLPPGAMPAGSAPPLDLSPKLAWLLLGLGGLELGLRAWSWRARRA